VIVAAFYAPRPGYAQHRYDFMECLRLQRASCQRFDCEHIVLTDLPRLGDFAVFQTALPLNVMLASLTAHLAYLNSDPNDDVLLLDADGLLNRDPRPLFDGSFDLAVTTHPFADSILNNGLIAVPKGAALAVAPFWGAALANCGIEWGQDQKALGAAVGATLNYGVEMREGVRVKFMPCTEHNWAPENEEDPVDATFVHFRGPRKTWMGRWAKRFADGG